MFRDVITRVREKVANSTDFYTCTRPCTGSCTRVHGPNTTVTWPCICHEHGRVQAVYTVCTWPCTRSCHVYTARTGLLHGRVCAMNTAKYITKYTAFNWTGRVHAVLYTNCVQVYTAVIRSCTRRVHCRVHVYVYTARVDGHEHSRAHGCVREQCTGAHDPYTAVNTAVYGPCT